MIDIFIVACGGAIGAVSRYLISNALLCSTFFRATSFPYATFIVNLSGCFVAGVIYYFAIKYFANFDLRLKNFLFVGLLGGYTTFSAFSLDFFRLITANQFQMAFIYALSSILFAILALFFGFYLMKILF